MTEVLAAYNDVLANLVAGGHGCDDHSALFRLVQEMSGRA